MKWTLALLTLIAAVAKVAAQGELGPFYGPFTKFAPAASGGNLTVTQIGTNFGTASPIVINVGSTFAAPGGVVVIAMQSASGAGTITPSDSRGNTYSVATNALNLANSCQIFVDYAPITTSLQSGDTISTAYTVNGANILVAAYYVSAMKSSAAYDVGATNVSAFGTSAPSGTSPSVAGGQNEASFVVFQVANGHTGTVGAPYAQLWSGVDHVTFTAGGWKQVTSGTQSYTLTVSGNDVTVGLVAVFKSQ